MSVKPLGGSYKEMRTKQREEDLLKYIKQFMVENGYTPTIRQMGYGMRLRSTATVKTYFDRLVSRGDIVQHGKNYSVKGMRYVSENGD